MDLAPLFLNLALSIASVDGEGKWALVEDLSSLSTVVDDNAASVTTILQSYATTVSVGGIAQVAIDVNGNITGWTAVNDSVSGSGFLIQADNFSITDQTTNYTPFSIDATGIHFDGKVAFTSLTGLGTTTTDAASVSNAIISNSTTIDGAKITTGTINAARINLSATDVGALPDSTSIPSTPADVCFRSQT